MNDDGGPVSGGADAVGARPAVTGGADGVGGRSAVTGGEPATTHATVPSISVVIPVHNGAATIADTLAALARQQVDEPFEVIVVDGASSDATVARVERYLEEERAHRGPVARLVRHDSRESGAVRNRGVRAAAGDLIAFTDADCAPEPDWLAAGRRAAANADIVQGRVLPTGPAGPFDRTLSVGHASGLYETANLFVSRSWFDRIGGFEARPGGAVNGALGRPFGEDTWFGWRAQRAGARITFAADSVVRHAVFPSGVRSHLIEQSRRRWFPGLVAEIPELRGTLLHRRLFLTPDTMRFDLAVAGVVVWSAAGHAARGRTRLATRTLAAAAILPYARRLGERSAAPDAGPGAALPDAGPGAAAPDTGPGAAATDTGLGASVLRRIAVAAALSAGDAVGAAALAAGSVRHRTAVL